MLAGLLDGTMGTPTKTLMASDGMCCITSGSLFEVMVMVLEVSLMHAHLPFFH